VTQSFHPTENPYGERARSHFARHRQHRARIDRKGSGNLLNRRSGRVYYRRHSFASIASKRIPFGHAAEKGEHVVSMMEGSSMTDISHDFDVLAERADDYGALWAARTF